MLHSHPDIAEQVVIEGGIEDHRNARFSMKHLRPAWLSEEEEEKLPEWVSDADFFLRLNHSRLLTSRLNWRPEIKYEIMVMFFGFYMELYV